MIQVASMLFISPHVPIVCNCHIVVNLLIQFYYTNLIRKIAYLYTKFMKIICRGRKISRKKIWRNKFLKKKFSENNLLEKFFLNFPGKIS